MENNNTVSNFEAANTAAMNLCRIEVLTTAATLDSDDYAAIGRSVLNASARLFMAHIAGGAKFESFTYEETYNAVHGN